MTKREDLYEQARILYVIHHLSKRAIGERLGISERSLQTWSTDNLDGKGTWDEQRAALTNNDETFHAELMSLGTVVARQIKDDLLNGNLDPKQVSNLDKIVKAAINAWRYAAKNPPKPGPVTPEARRDEIQRKIRDKLGLR